MTIYRLVSKKKGGSRGNEVGRDGEVEGYLGVGYKKIVQLLEFTTFLPK